MRIFIATYIIIVTTWTEKIIELTTNQTYTIPNLKWWTFIIGITLTILIIQDIKELTK